jgi:hypothetical protein
MLRMLFLSTVMIVANLFHGGNSFANEAEGIDTIIQPGSISVSKDGNARIIDFLKYDYRYDITVNNPAEIESLISSIKGCDVTLGGWDKEQFLAEWRAEQSEISKVTTMLLRQGAIYRSGLWRQVNPDSLPAGAMAGIPPDIKRLAEALKGRGAEVDAIEVQGTSGSSIFDPEILKDDGNVSDDDVVTSVSVFISIALPRLYDWLQNTPSACYTPDQLMFMNARIQDTFGGKNARAHLFEGQDTVEIECGNPKTHSRFIVPPSQLSAVVSSALQNNSGPLGPAGLYFSRSWFFRNAVGQMFARGKWEVAR